MNLTKKFWDKLKLRNKLILFFVLLTLIPITIISIMYYKASIKNIVEITQKRVYEVIKKNNEVFDAKLLEIGQSSTAMIVDEDLFKIAKNFNSLKGSDYLRIDRDLPNIIVKYFTFTDDIYSVQLINSRYQYGPGHLPLREFLSSKIYDRAMRAKGELVWIPTYDFTQMYGAEDLKDVDLEYRYLFSAVRQLNSTFIKHSDMQMLDDDDERSVLLINIKESFFKDTIESSIKIKNTKYYILSKEGGYVSHPDETKLGTKYSNAEVLETVKGKSGWGTISEDGKNFIICYDVSSITGWTSLVIIPQKDVLNQIIPKIRSFTINISLILTVVSLFLAYLISKGITKPVQNLKCAVKEITGGNFNTVVSNEGDRELKDLIDKFNEMNCEIKTLIKENYEVKIREKEAHIMALNLQMNPHFLYNTLNMINWVAMEKGQDEISMLIVHLSSMLQYAVKNRNETALLKDEIKWLKSYFIIMENRFEKQFESEISIARELLDYMVPKLFLQPFVENALVHGTEGVDYKVTVKVGGYKKDGFVLFVIEDNGKGMSEKEIKKVFKDNKDNSIGISNINKRIKLIYGEEYCVEIQSKLNTGTRVIIKLPGYSPIK